jgi:hypothetical protein
MRHGAQSLRNKDLRHLFFDTPEPHLYDTAPMSTPQIDRSTCSGWRAIGSW